ncbi:MAG: methyltransferase domain-containing protein [Hyphomicrobiaceae bacterium]
MDTTDRLVALLDHLGLAKAHVATQMPGDVAGLSLRHPERLAGLVLAVPVRLDPTPFLATAARILMITGETGISAAATRRAGERLTAAQRHALAGYEAGGWADVAADRTDELADRMVRFLGRIEASTPLSVPAADRMGSHAGLSYTIDGQGPALLLLPFFLAASQWDPVVPQLARQFTVIRVGGAHIGGIATLEDRASAPTYLAMFDILTGFLGVQPHHRILDVGCGSGALDRHLAARLGPTARIDAVDINAFMLGEAEALAKAQGLDSQIRFGKGSALDLPFVDATFDAVYSVTVLEECDADQAIAEIMRVTKPGGRIGIAVRAIDIPQWWNLDLPPALRAKVDIPPQSLGPGGVADRSLYARLQKAGLVDLVAFPQLVTLDRPDGPTWRYREDHILSLLTADEVTTWKAACAKAGQAGLLMQANALHCAVATKPSQS